MTKSDEERGFEEFIESFYDEYYSNGRDKKHLVSFLKDHPYTAEYLIKDIIEHLENPRKRYLKKRDNLWKAYHHYEITSMFLFGPNYFPPLNGDESLENNNEWTQKSYDEKIYQLAKEFPEYSRSYIEKIISLNKKQ